MTWKTEIMKRETHIKFLQIFCLSWTIDPEGKRKMEKVLVLVGGLLLSNQAFAERGDFTVSSIGASSQTNTIFIETAESASSSTTCRSRKLFRLPDTDKSADRLFSLALAAQAQKKKITLDYSVTECLENGILIQVFRLKE